MNFEKVSKLYVIYPSLINLLIKFFKGKNMNKPFDNVLVMGNLGTDPELKNLEGGTKLVDVPVSVTFQSADKKEVTEWHQLRFLNAHAELVSESLEKGSYIQVEGRLSKIKYRKDGQNHFRSSVLVDGIINF